MEVVDSSISNHRLVEADHLLVVELRFFLSEILFHHHSSSREEEEEEVVEYSSPLHCEVTTLSVRTRGGDLDLRFFNFGDGGQYFSAIL